MDEAAVACSMAACSSDVPYGRTLRGSRLESSTRSILAIHSSYNILLTFHLSSRRAVPYDGGQAVCKTVKIKHIALHKHQTTSTAMCTCPVHNYQTAESGHRRSAEGTIVVCS